MNLQLVSLFAGVGGFDIAAERVGIDPVVACEIDPQARGVLQHRFPNTNLINDVKEVTGDKLRELGLDPKRTVITGGFPCQDLSVAGKQAGLEGGERSSLFFEIVRILREFNPQWFILENVPGLLSSKGGRDMEIVVGGLAELGYSFSWRVLDAQNFGVPQRRRRVFIVGHLGADATRVEQVLFEPESGRGNLEAGQSQGQDATAEPTQGTDFDSFRMIETIGFSHTQGLDAQPSTTAFPTLRREGNGHAVAIPIDLRNAFRDPEKFDAMNRQGLGVGNEGNPAHTLTSAFVPGVAHGADPSGATCVVRRLTPVECERLQGFPDGWSAQRFDHKKGVVVDQADSSRYKQMGNAVAVPVVEWILGRLGSVHTADDQG